MFNLPINSTAFILEVYNEFSNDYSNIIISNKYVKRRYTETEVSINNNLNKIIFYRVSFIFLVLFNTLRFAYNNLQRLDWTYNNYNYAHI